MQKSRLHTRHPSPATLISAPCGRCHQSRQDPRPAPRGGMRRSQKFWRLHFYPRRSVWFWRRRDWAVGLRKRSRGSFCSRPDPLRLERKFPVAGNAMDVSACLAEEKPCPHGLERMRFQHQRDLPRFWKEALVDGNIRIGKKNFAPCMRVIPSYGYLRPSPPARGAQQLLQFGVIPV
jgi:hypothetical protein